MRTYCYIVVGLLLILAANLIWFVATRKPQVALVYPPPANTTDLIYIPEPVAADTTPYPYRVPKPTFAWLVVVDRDVLVKDYFAFIDSMVLAFAPYTDCELTEYTLVHNNPWIIDTLVSFDYYERMRKGEFVFDQKQMVVLRQGSILFIPTKARADSINQMLANTQIDVNIPEFKLRIVVDSVARFTIPVRVGRDERKYLAMAGREVSLRTPIGKGEIVRIVRNAAYINPVDNKRYYGTNRDDKRYTKLPLVPWLEPTIDGRRQGSLIHPTTNEATLGKPYSNACVGMPEGAAWRVYYFAPLGTQVNFRYDLDIVNETGDTTHLKDIYHLRHSAN